MSGSGFFERTEFNTGNGPQDPEEAIRERHDPKVAYAHILKLSATIDSGLEAVPEENQTAVEVYSAVDLFRATIQYIEEFGTYLRAQAVSDESFIESLIRTSASNLVPFFKACQNHTLDSYLDNQDCQLDATEWISEQFGYQQMQDGRIQPPDESSETPSEEELSEYIEGSISYIEAELEAIATFYLNFKEAYNAVKHGNRVMVNPSPRFTVDSEQTEAQDLETDDTYASFLCKESGDTGGNPYILTLPSSFLERWSLDIADRVNQLYTHAYEITTISQGDRVSVDFYRAGASGGGETISYFSIQNTDGTIIVPKKDVPEVVSEFELEEGLSVELVASWSLSGSTLHFEIKYATEPTPDYPIEVSLQLEETDSLRELGRGQFNFSVDPGRLSVSKYLELLNIQNRDDISDIEFKFPDREVFTESLQDSFEGIQLPQPEDREFLEFVKRIELANQTRIPFPLAYSDEHYNVFEEYQNEDLDRDTAEEVLSKFEETGEETLSTKIIAEIWYETQEQVEAEDIDPEKRLDLGLMDGCVEIQGDGIEKNRGEPGEVLKSEPAPSSYSAQEIIEMIEKEGIQGLSEVTEQELAPEERESKVGYKVFFGGETIWGTTDTLYVGIFRE